jgi:transposase
MELDRVNHLEQIPLEDWGKTPTSVKKLVEEMAQQIEQQSKKLREVLTVQEQLLEKINRTSVNSSSPPSSDPPGFGKKPVKQKSSKKRGGQPGHKGNSRDLYPIEECNSVIDHHPEECSNCGTALTGVDTNPYRHQIVEIPPILPIVIEHRLHQLTCTGCGTKTRATLPEFVNPSKQLYSKLITTKLHHGKKLP